MNARFLSWPASGKADDWFTLGRFALFLGLLIFAMFPDVVLGSETFYYRDYGIYSYPLAYYHRLSFWRGEVPLWNPLNNAGLPFLAQWNTLALYPPALFYLLLPLPWSLGMFCLGHLFLAGIGMYLLAHRWSGNRLAASVAGVAYAFNGFTWHSLMWTNTIAALGWMPLVVLCTERAWRDGRHWILLAAFAGALQMLTGAAEVILMTWGLTGALWIGEELISSRTTWARKRQTGWRCAAVILLVTGLAAAQLGPFLDLLAHSQRDPGFGGTDWSMPGLGWANFLVPLFYCYRSFQGVFVQYGQYWTTSYYLSIGVLLLAVWGAWHVRQRRVWILAGALLLSLVLALGEHGYLYTWLRRAIPALGFMRFPIKFVMLTVFLVPLLAAFALAHYRALTPDDWLKRRRGFAVLTGVFLGGILIVVWCARNYPMWKDDWATTFHSALGRALFLGASLAALVGWRQFRSVRGQWLCGLGMLVLSCADVRTHAPELNPRVAPSVYQPGLVCREVQFNPPPRHGESRAMIPTDSLRRLQHMSVGSPAQDYLGRRLALFGNCNLLDEIPKLNGFYPLYLKESDDVLALLQFNPPTEVAGLIDFLNVSQTIVPGTLMDWTNRSYLPLVTGGQRPVFAKPSAILAALQDRTFASREVVYLPPELRSQVSVTNGAQVEIVRSHFQAHRVDLEVRAAAPALLTIAQAYYHPWKAYVAGRLVPLWRGNYAFQTLTVPAGKHQVRVVYEDTVFRVGLLISGATLLVCLAAAWIVWRGRAVAQPQFKTRLETPLTYFGTVRRAWSQGGELSVEK